MTTKLTIILLLSIASALVSQTDTTSTSRRELTLQESVARLFI